jgi:hypothetical protein
MSLNLGAFMPSSFHTVREYYHLNVKQDFVYVPCWDVCAVWWAPGTGYGRLSWLPRCVPLAHSLRVLPATYSRQVPSSLLHCVVLESSVGFQRQVIDRPASAVACSPAPKEGTPAELEIRMDSMERLSSHVCSSLWTECFCGACFDFIWLKCSVSSECRILTLLILKCHDRLCWITTNTVLRILLFCTFLQ